MTTGNTSFYADGPGTDAAYTVSGGPNTGGVQAPNQESPTSFYADGPGTEMSVETDANAIAAAASAAAAAASAVTAANEAAVATTEALAAAASAASFTGFANPTNNIGLTVDNGVATTAMRSDATPALNQAIAPFWTALHTFEDGITLSAGELMLGPNTPTAPLTITPQTAALPTPLIGGTIVHVIGSDGSNSGVELDAFQNGGSSVQGIVGFRGANGTLASPSALTAANGSIGAFNWFGYNGSAYVQGGRIRGLTSENWGASNGFHFDFGTVAAGSTSVATAMSIYGGVVIGSGTTDPGAGNLSVGGSIAGAGQTITAGTLAAGAQASVLTATQPASPTSGQNAISWTVTGAGSASFGNNAFVLTYAAGYTGSSRTIGFAANNSNASTGSTLIPAAGSIAVGGNFGFGGTGYGSTTGLTCGGYGLASNGNISVGLLGVAQVAKASALNIGVAGSAINTGSSGLAVGGFFSLNQTTVPTVTAALLVDGNSNGPAAFFLGGGVGIGVTADPGAGNLAVGGGATIASTTASSSSTTGALTVAGGVGIAGALFSGGNLTALGQANTFGSPSTAGYAAWFFGTTTNDQIRIGPETTDYWKIGFNTSTGYLTFTGAGAATGMNLATGTLILSAYSNPGTLGVTTSAGVDGVGTVIAGGYVTPQMYGAAGNGTTDDTTALSNCLNSGKPVLLVGTFKISSQITVTLNDSTGPLGLNVIGAGQMLSQILLTTQTSGITVDASYSGNGNTNTQVVLKDFSLVAEYAGVGSSTVGALNVIGSPQIGSVASNYLIENVTVTSNSIGTNYAFVGIFLKDVRNGWVRDCNLVGLDYNTANTSGIVFTSSDNGSTGNAPCDASFEGCHITAFNYGIELRASGDTNHSYENDWQGVHIDACTILSCNYNIYANSTDVNANGLTITNCITSFYTHAVYINNVQGFNISNNYWENVGGNSITFVAATIGTTAAVCLGTYTGNTHYNSPYTGGIAISASASGSGVMKCVASGNVSYGYGATNLTYTVTDSSNNF